MNAMDGDGEPEDDPAEKELRDPSMQEELEMFGHLGRSATADLRTLHTTPTIPPGHTERNRP